MQFQLRCLYIYNIKLNANSYENRTGILSEDRNNHEEHNNNDNQNISDDGHHDNHLNSSKFMRFEFDVLYKRVYPNTLFLDNELLPVASSQMQATDPLKTFYKSVNNNQDWAPVPLDESEFREAFIEQIITPSLQNYANCDSNPITPYETIKAFHQHKMSTVFGKNLQTINNDNIQHHKDTNDGYDNLEHTDETKHNCTSTTANTQSFILTHTLWPTGPLARIKFPFIEDDMNEHDDKHKKKKKSSLHQYIFPVLFHLYHSYLIIAVPLLNNIDYSKISCRALSEDCMVLLNHPELTYTQEFLGELGVFTERYFERPLPIQQQQQSQTPPFLLSKFSFRLLVQTMIPFGRPLVYESNRMRQFAIETLLTTTPSTNNNNNNNNLSESYEKLTPNYDWKMKFFFQNTAGQLENITLLKHIITQKTHQSDDHDNNVVSPSSSKVFLNKKQNKWKQRLLLKHYHHQMSLDKEEVEFDRNDQCLYRDHDESTSIMDHNNNKPIRLNRLSKLKISIGIPERYITKNIQGIGQQIKSLSLMTFRPIFKNRNNVDWIAGVGACREKCLASDLIDAYAFSIIEHDSQPQKIITSSSSFVGTKPGVPYLGSSVWDFRNASLQNRSYNNNDQPSSNLNRQSLNNTNKHLSIQWNEVLHCVSYGFTLDNNNNIISPIQKNKGSSIVVTCTLRGFVNLQVIETIYNTAIDFSLSYIPIIKGFCVWKEAVCVIDKPLIHINDDEEQQQRQQRRRYHIQMSPPPMYPISLIRATFSIPPTLLPVIGTFKLKIQYPVNRMDHKNIDFNHFYYNNQYDNSDDCCFCISLNLNITLHIMIAALDKMKILYIRLPLLYDNDLPYQCKIVTHHHVIPSIGTIIMSKEGEALTWLCSQTSLQTLFTSSTTTSSSQYETITAAGELTLQCTLKHPTQYFSTSINELEHGVVTLPSKKIIEEDADNDRSRLINTIYNKLDDGTWHDVKYMDTFIDHPTFINDLRLVGDDRQIFLPIERHYIEIFYTCLGYSMTDATISDVTINDTSVVNLNSTSQHHHPFSLYRSYFSQGRRYVIFNSSS